MRQLLKSIWKENGQSWYIELNEENRHEFKKRASEMIHVNQMALKRTYFESGVNKVVYISSQTRRWKQCAWLLI